MSGHRRDYKMNQVRGLHKNMITDVSKNIITDIPIVRRDIKEIMK